MQIDSTSLASQSGLLGAFATGESPSTTAGNGVTSLKRSDNVSDMFGLGKDDFFKLFLVQLKNQDPTKPMDDKDFLAQLAQFSLIDTLQGVQKSMAGTQLAQASNLIGKHVEGHATDGTAVSGTVSMLVQDDQGLLLLVGTKTVKPDGVTLVAPILNPTTAP